jgi:K+-transporting ATPase ATPase A chain
MPVKRCCPTCPDGRPHHSQLPVGGHRHRRCLCPVSRLCPRETSNLGNFWADCTRITLYVLLPACVVYALFLVASGVPQTLPAWSMPPRWRAQQAIVLGPVASQEAIKMLGTNGGGFFNANSAHPFENPTALVDFRPDALDLRAGAGLTYTFGRPLATRARAGPFSGPCCCCSWPVHRSCGGGSRRQPALTTWACWAPTWKARKCASAQRPAPCSAAVTTAASCGAVNAMHDSFTALGGMIPLFNMQLGEIVIGGVGSGIYGFLLFAVLAVFLAGLMVGRTPEYVGKKIEAREVKLAVLAIVILPLCILGSRPWPWSCRRPCRAAGQGAAWLLGNPLCLHLGHGQQRIGLCRADRRHAVLQRPAGRGDVARPLPVVIPVLAIAGSLAARKQTPAGPGSFPPPVACGSACWSARS